MQNTPLLVSSPVRRLLFRTPILFALLLTPALSLAIHAASPPTATAQISGVSLGGGEFDYTITLEDTGTTTIGTFWNCWVPGQDYMAVSPTNIISPTGWSDSITGGGGSDGYAIRCVASSDLLQPATTGTFQFESTVTPSAMDGDSIFYPTTPVETSFVYSGAPFSDVGDDFIVQSVPEPSTIFLAALGVTGLLCARSRKLRIFLISHPAAAGSSIINRENTGRISFF